jgi:hypothetical protein
MGISCGQASVNEANQVIVSEEVSEMLNLEKGDVFQVFAGPNYLFLRIVDEDKDE